MHMQFCRNECAIVVWLSPISIFHFVYKFVWEPASVSHSKLLLAVFHSNAASAASSVTLLPQQLDHAQSHSSSTAVAASSFLWLHPACMRQLVMNWIEKKMYYQKYDLDKKRMLKTGMPIPEDPTFRRQLLNQMLIQILIRKVGDLGLLLKF